MAPRQSGVGAAAGKSVGVTEGKGSLESGAASRPGYAGRSRAAAATSPTYGRHVAGAGWRKVGVYARAARRGGAGPRG